ncbi:MAG: hypothetical protein NT023_09860 [Armatimonadetes bacterium]|nr:hypothetical protein [Armatimonadota bacterium]
MKVTHFVRLTAVASLLLLPAIAALAQEAPVGGNAPVQGRQRGGGRNGGRFTLVMIPIASLKSSLQLTDEQATKIEAIQKKASADTRALRQPGQPPSPESLQQIRDIGMKATKEVESLLTDDQKKKVAPLVKELGGYQSIGIPLTVLDALKLTDEQKKKIGEIIEKAQKDIKALPQEEQRQKGREIRQASREEAAKLLTDDQKKELEKAQQAIQQRRRGAGGNNQ